MAKDLYESVEIADLVIDQPATFDTRAITDGLKTLVLLCDSEAMEHISYKPDYPQSFFHLTLYDGEPSLLAARAFEAIGRLNWRLAYRGRLVRHETPQVAAEVAGVELRKGVLLSRSAARILDDLHPEADLRPGGLTEAERLTLIVAVAERLHSSTDVYAAARVPDRDYLRLSSRPDSQVAFWTASQVNELSGMPIPRASLRQNSTYITPPEIAADVIGAVSEYLEDELIDFGDPSIGSGILYAAARQKMGPDRLNSARGVEIDSESAAKTLHRWRHTNLSVLVGDFLEQEPEIGAWSLVAANPPYRRSQRLPAAAEGARARIAVETGISISGRADLYMYFVLAADAWMREGGVAAWILPAEFQVAKYALPLRKYLSSRVQLLRIHTYDTKDSVFDNALTSTSVVVFRKTPPSRTNLALISARGSAMNPIDSRRETSEALERMPRWNFDFLGAKPMADDSAPVGQYFDVRRGIATGSNEHFVLSSEQLELLQVDREWVRPLIPRARHLVDGVVTSDDLGGPVPPSDLWLIDTQRPLSELDEESPAFANYLRSIPPTVLDRALVRRRRPVYKQELRDVPPFVFVYMAKDTVPSKRRFVRNESQAVALNNFLLLYPKASFRSWMTLAPENFISVHESLSRIPLESLLAHGRSYGHSLLKLEPSDLRRVPFTPPSAFSLFLGEYVRSDDSGS